MQAGLCWALRAQDGRLFASRTFSYGFLSYMDDEYRATSHTIGDLPTCNNIRTDFQRMTWNVLTKVMRTSLTGKSLYIIPENQR